MSAALLSLALLHKSAYGMPPTAFRQATDPSTGKPLFEPDGNPTMVENKGVLENYAASQPDTRNMWQRAGGLGGIGGWLKNNALNYSQYAVPYWGQSLGIAQSGL